LSDEFVVVLNENRFAKTLRASKGHLNVGKKTILIALHVQILIQTTPSSSLVKKLNYKYKSSQASFHEEE
jgi:hypothetical protein